MFGHVYTISLHGQTYTVYELSEFSKMLLTMCVLAVFFATRWILRMPNKPEN